MIPSEITPEELKSKLDRGDKTNLIDIRQPEEFEICHLKSAKLMNPNEIEKLLAELNPRELAVLYCHHGIRSNRVVLWLRQKGFENIQSLEGGIDAWAERMDPAMKRY